jgi:hypothetical protein
MVRAIPVASSLTSGLPRELNEIEALLTQQHGALGQISPAAEPTVVLAGGVSRPRASDDVAAA